MFQYPWSHSHTRHSCIDFQIITFHIRQFALVGWNTTNPLPHGSLNTFIFIAGLCFPTLDDHDLKSTYLKLKVSHECIQAFFLHW
jgi:hypothetical protein